MGCRVLRRDCRLDVPGGRPGRLVLPSGRCLAAALALAVPAEAVAAAAFALVTATTATAKAVAAAAFALAHAAADAAACAAADAAACAAADAAADAAAADAAAAANVRQEPVLDRGHRCPKPLQVCRGLRFHLRHGQEKLAERDRCGESRMLHLPPSPQLYDHVP